MVKNTKLRLAGHPGSLQRWIKGGVTVPETEGKKERAGGVKEGHR